MISVDVNTICDTLINIGLEEGDNVLIHSSIGLMFGQQDNPSELLYTALRKTVGDSGTIAVPTFTLSACQGAVFDVENTPSEVGNFSNYVLALDGACRSSHPIHSVAAVGPNAQIICNHESPSSFGRNSSYEKIIGLNSHILLVGAGINYLSLIHQVEEDLKVPYRYYKVFDINVKHGDVFVEAKVPYFARFLDREVVYDYEKRLDMLLGSKAINMTRLGWGNILYGRSNKLYDSLYDRVKADSQFLILK